MPAEVRDVVVPAFVLLDFCNSIVSFRGNLYLPPSSNVSLYRDAAGTHNATRGGQIQASGSIINQGWVRKGFVLLLCRLRTHLPRGARAQVLLVLSNSSNRDVKQPPPNGTTYSDLLVATIPATTPFAFQLSNRTQLWQAGFPGIKCQTVGQFPLVSSAPVAGGGTQSRWSLLITTFDQCVYDWTIFVGVVAGVGGAIILAAIIYGIVYIVRAIHKSMNAPAAAITYTQMERGDEEDF